MSGNLLSFAIYSTSYDAFSSVENLLSRFGQPIKVNWAYTSGQRETLQVSSSSCTW